MFSKFLRKILVIACQVVLLGSMTAVFSSAQSPEDLSVRRIEQIRANLPEIRIYVQGASEELSCEAYLDGEQLTYTGTESLDENGTSYLIMLDISGSIQPDYFISEKEQILELAKSLGPKDRLTLITFGDSVKMEVSGCQSLKELKTILDPLEAKDQKTCLYEAFEQCLKYAESTAQEERQIVLVFSDGMQDTGSIGVTQSEIEEQLMQASMPVYSFCVDTAKTASQEEFGRFARTTGGELTVFRPENALEMLQNWQADLKQVGLICFKGSTNYADGALHTLLLKTTLDGVEQSDTRKIRLTNWAADTVPPEIASISYNEKQNTIDIQFTEPVLGAENLSAYELQRNGKVQKIEQVVLKEERCYQIVLPEDLAAGTYTFSISNVYDDSMEKNPLKADRFTFRKAFGWRDARPFVAVGVMGIIVCGEVVILLRKKKEQPQPMMPQKIEYEVQHIVTVPKTSVSSPIEDAQTLHVVLEIAGGAQSGQQVEVAIHKSAIWGRSKEMCDVSFDDQRISKQHCVFEVEGKSLLLSDLQSQNGTYLNGVRIQGKTVVRRGDVLQIGNTILKIAGVSE